MEGLRHGCGVIACTLYLKVSIPQQTSIRVLFNLLFFGDPCNKYGPYRHIKSFDVRANQKSYISKARAVMNFLCNQGKKKISDIAEMSNDDRYLMKCFYS